MERGGGGPSRDSADSLPDRDTILFEDYFGGTRGVERMSRLSKVRLVLADLDGTIFGKEKRAEQLRLKRLRNSLSGYGVRFSIATGRTLFGASQFIQALELPKSLPVILYNGSVVLDRKAGKSLVLRRIPLGILSRILSKVKDRPCEVLAYSINLESKVDGCAWIHSESLETVRGWSNLVKMGEEFNGMEIDWHDWDETVEGSAPSAILIRADGDPSDLESEIHSLAQHVTITRSGGDHLEIRPRGSNKAVAAAHVASSMKVRDNEVLAIGDNDNDRELLDWAGIGVAVGESSGLAREASDFVTKHPSTSGVFQVLETLVDANYYYSRMEEWTSDR